MKAAKKITIIGTFFGQKQLYIKAKAHGLNAIAFSYNYISKGIRR